MKNEITINKKINIIKNILKLHIEIVSMRKCTLTDKQALSICNKCIRDSKKSLKNIEKIKHKDIIESLYNTLVSKNETWFYFFAPLINGKNVKRWDSTKIGYKEFQELEREAQVDYLFPKGTYVKMEIDCYFPLNKGDYGKNGLNKSGRTKIARTYCDKKPDIDNVMKAILDGLNGMAYSDDSQVVDISCSKCYTELSPRVEIRMKEIGILKENQINEK